MYDLIGDIHGHARTLEALLRELDYTQRAGVYRHPERKVVFLGDFVDRGPLIKETLQLVRPMVEQGAALAVMGNHEFNTLSYYTTHRQSGEWLRERSEKNVKQQIETEESFANAQTEFSEALDWFRTLPLYLELEHAGQRLRVIHACWSDKHLQALNQLLPDGRLTVDFLEKAAQWRKPDQSLECELVETLIKGPEYELPAGLVYADKGGTRRRSVRLKWWGAPPPAPRWRDIALSLPDDCPFKDDPVPPADLEKLTGMLRYPVTDPPVFFGHYWMKGIPALLQPNLCCLDYSVADRKALPADRQLVAYRWNGEQMLNAKHFVSMPLQEAQ